VLTFFRDTAALARSSSLPELSDDVIWIDLLNPTKEETTLVELRIKVRIPSIESLNEIESSSRLAVDREVLYQSDCCTPQWEKRWSIRDAQTASRGCARQLNSTRPGFCSAVWLFEVGSNY
jgi:hypothetical protein